MNTLHIDLGRDWRGGQSQVLLLLRGLRARGHGAELLGRGNSPLSRRAAKHGVPVHTVGARATRLRAAFRLRRLLTRKEFDLLHAHDAHSLTAAWLAGAHRRTAVVASRRVAYALRPNPWAQARYRSASRLLAISRFAAQSALASGLPPQEVEVVYDGVELPPLPSPELRQHARRRWGAQQNHQLLGCVGTLLPDKGQEFLVRALPALRAEFPFCRLLLAGDGPCRARLERLALVLGVESAVQLAGFVEDIEQVYVALDIFVSPALLEGLSSSLLAAMAYGLPVVAVGQEAAPEVIEDKRTGLLIPDRDPATIASAVACLLREEGLAHCLGAAARSRIKEQFTADHMVEETLRIYRELSLQERRA